MDYSHIYNQLMLKGQLRQAGKRRTDLVVLLGHVERHHIVPRCLNGLNSTENLVYLTPEEHYVAHELLVKIHPTEIALLRALMILSGRNNKYRNNKLFGWARRRYSEMRKGSVPPNKGIPHSEETKTKIRAARKLQIITEETKIKISVTGSGSGNSFFGRKHKEESKLKISEANASSRQVSCDGVIYNSMLDAAEAFGFKRYETVKKRCLSDKYTGWFIL